MAEQDESLDAQSLKIVRLALLAGTLSLGAAGWIVSGGEGLAPELIDGKELYVWAVLAIGFVGLFGGVLAVRVRWQAAEGISAKGQNNIIGWALAEPAGLVGALYLMMVGDPIFFGAGVALQGLASFVLLPIPAEEGTGR